jgi:hypothetical protein
MVFAACIQPRMCESCYVQSTAPASTAPTPHSDPDIFTESARMRPLSQHVRQVLPCLVVDVAKIAVFETGAAGTEVSGALQPVAIISGPSPPDPTGQARQGCRLRYHIRHPRLHVSVVVNVLSGAVTTPSPHVGL